MKRMMLMATVVLLSSVGLEAGNQKKKVEALQAEVEMFPKADLGFKQVVIKVPAKKNEDKYQLEIFVGKTELLDCNKYFMIGSIKEENLEGWGYNFYTVDSKGALGGTRMACLDGKKTNQFVHIPSVKVRYNSRLPIVIYVPEGLEVRYKIWTASKKSHSALVLDNTVKTTGVSNAKVENKKWQLMELNGKAVDSQSNTHYLIFHSANKRIEAKAGCNLLNIEYEIKNEFQLRIAEGLSTMMACPDSFLEDDFLKMLRMVDNLSTDGKTLTLNKARMAPLAVFKLVE